MAKNQAQDTVTPEVEATEAVTPEVLDQNTAPVYRSIEDMRVARQTSAAIFSGTCIAMNWRQGKMVTEAEYDAAIQAFSSAPMGTLSASEGGLASAT